MSNINNKNNTNLHIALFAISLERARGKSLQLQLTDALRNLILGGDAKSGMVLPSTRRLAQELSVSRVTTHSCYEQLIAEGYLEPRPGSGTFVAAELPEFVAPTPEIQSEPSTTVDNSYPVFRPGIPDLSAFPHHQWARHLDRVWRNPDPALLREPDPAGWMPLRRAIADHLRTWRNIPCTAAYVVITSGAAQAFDLIAQSYMRKGQSVYFEDPGYAPLRMALERAELSGIACPVDEQGFDINTARLLCKANAAIVTPSRHYPLGMTMPLGRRLALLEWAAEANALVVEDDYDGEFRYRGRPLPAFMSLDSADRVIYVGSFSKLFSPSLRIGYAVVPERLIPPLIQSLNKAGTSASLTPQPALAAFMESGEFAIHLRRMRRIYASRQRHLQAEIERLLPDHLICPDDPAGMHLVCSLGPALAGRVTGQQIANACAEMGLGIRAATSYAANTTMPDVLILGFAAFDEQELTEGVNQLANILHGF